MLADGEYHELNDRLELTQGDQNLARLVAEGAQPKTSIRVDSASAIVEEDGVAYRIPFDPGYQDMSKENGEADSKRTLEDHLSLSLTKGARVKASGSTGTIRRPRHWTAV